MKQETATKIESIKARTERQRGIIVNFESQIDFMLAERVKQPPLGIPGTLRVRKDSPWTARLELEMQKRRDRFPQRKLEFENLCKILEKNKPTKKLIRGAGELNCAGFYANFSSTTHSFCSPQA